MSVSFLSRPGKPDLAYKMQAGESDLPPLIFLPGFRSDMEGTKAVFLAEHAAKRKQPCLRLDYSGHGASGGRFEEGTIGVWKEDALAIIDATIKTPAIVIGSSMGGWIALLVALARPHLVKGLIGIAAAPDFTRDVQRRMSDAQRQDIKKQGFFSVTGEYSPEPLVITRALLEEGENHCIMDGEIGIDCPVRLLQGKKDDDVPWEWAGQIQDRLRTTDKMIILREEGDHRLSTPEDLAILAALADELSEKA